MTSSGGGVTRYLCERRRASPPPRPTGYFGFVFERFTEQARQAIVFGQEEARRLGHNYIGTEHLLLGVLREEAGVGARVLTSLGVTVDAVRAQVGRIVGQGEAVATGQISFTPRVKRVMELSLREALGLGHDYIGTEHLLLALIREPEGVAARILVDFDLDADKIRERAFEVLGTERPANYARSMERAGRVAATDWIGAARGGRLSWSLAAVLPMVIGALVFGAGLAVGWLIWG